MLLCLVIAVGAQVALQSQTPIPDDSHLAQAQITVFIRIDPIEDKRRAGKLMSRDLAVTIAIHPLHSLLGARRAILRSGILEGRDADQ